jgi:hypothetical protein
VTENRVPEGLFAQQEGLTGLASERGMEQATGRVSFPQGGLESTLVAGKGSLMSPSHEEMVEQGRLPEGVLQCTTNP